MHFFSFMLHCKLLSFNYIIRVGKHFRQLKIFCLLAANPWQFQSVLSASIGFSFAARLAGM